MKNICTGLKAAVAGLALTISTLFPTGVSAYDNTLTFQGVTFNTGLVGNIFWLQILNATSATGNWSGVTFLSAFEIKDIGSVSSGTVVGGTNIGNPTDWSNPSGGVNSSALGCNGGGGSGGCFAYTPSVGLTLNDLMVWQIQFTGSNLDFELPSLKVAFGPNLNHPSKPQGDLLSQTIPAIPEPEIYALMGVGLGLLGWVGRRKKLKEAAAV